MKIKEDYKQGMLKVLIESMEDWEKELYLNLLYQDYMDELLIYVNRYWLEKFLDILKPSHKNRNRK